MAYFASGESQFQLRDQNLKALSSSCESTSLKLHFGHKELQLIITAQLNFLAATASLCGLLFTCLSH